MRQGEENLPARFHAQPNVERSQLLQLPGLPFRIDLDGPDMALARRLEEDAVPFRELGFVSLGMVFHEARAGGRRKQHYLSAERKAPFTVPLVDGEHVRRWRFAGELWLDYCPTEHREPRFPELFDPPKLICRRIIGRHRIMAVPDESGLYFSDNAVGFVPWHALAACGARVVRGQARPDRVARSAGVDLFYLAAVLNSRLLSWYYRTLLGFGVHFYPAHLKQLPVRVAPAEEQRALAELAREAAHAWSGVPQAPTRSQQARLDRIDGEIDRRVERLYGLTVRERGLLSREGTAGSLQ